MRLWMTMNTTLDVDTDDESVDVLAGQKRCSEAIDQNLNNWPLTFLWTFPWIWVGWAFESDNGDDEALGLADRRDAARPIRQDLSNWVTVGSTDAVSKKFDDCDESESWWVGYFWARLFRITHMKICQYCFSNKVPVVCKNIKVIIDNSQAWVKYVDIIKNKEEICI